MGRVERCIKRIERASWSLVNHGQRLAAFVSFLGPWFHDARSAFVCKKKGSARVPRLGSAEMRRHRVPTACTNALTFQKEANAYGRMTSLPSALVAPGGTFHCMLSFLLVPLTHTMHAPPFWVFLDPGPPLSSSARINRADGLFPTCAIFRGAAPKTVAVPCAAS
ncbi:hypothetical protein BC940DRAFT_287398 [Gongronella butleri]|nr:hypothetical protein BC940DRAFT_287398 [Gongronella butleri]